MTGPDDASPLPAAGGDARAAAFFDVDGTIVASNIVHYYAWFRRQHQSAWWGAIWQRLFLFKCLYYLILDRIDRSRLNTVFYRNYRGLSVERLHELACACHNAVLKPNLFREAQACMEEHRAAGRKVVLVTGSVDFIIRPLARLLRVDDLIACELVEAGGVFTGGLAGTPIGQAEKAVRMRSWAEANHIDLTASYAYGDSIADLPMLEAAGHPRPVNADGPLSRIARERGWTTHRWAQKRGRADDDVVASGASSAGERACCKLPEAER